jgi:inosine/xanthosine triphosphatase
MIQAIAVGSANPVKIAAVKAVVVRIWPQASVTGAAVNPGVALQPLSDEEAIAGATNRARLALVMMDADLGLGLEGATVDMAHGMYTTSWVVAIGRDGAMGIGGGGRLPLPAAVAQAIRSGRELGPLMDEVAGQHNTKQKQGAVGILTAGLVTRQQALEVAVTYALARFVATAYYG